MMYRELIVCETAIGQSSHGIGSTGELLTVSVSLAFHNQIIELPVMSIQPETWIQECCSYCQTERV